jgi:hypothetical protein
MFQPPIRLRTGKNFQSNIQYDARENVDVCGAYSDGTPAERVYNPCTSRHSSDRLCIPSTVVDLLAMFLGRDWLVTSLQPDQQIAEHNPSGSADGP